MTGESGMVIMTEDTLRIMNRVRDLREEGVKAYYSMQTGPSVFINTDDKHQRTVFKAITKLGYRAYLSGVGREATML